jgi:ribosome-associated heat shock protein Hsp15
MRFLALFALIGFSIWAWASAGFQAELGALTPQPSTARFCLAAPMARAGPLSRVAVAAASIVSAVDSIRIDKWLWAARFFKSRGAATEAVVGGRVRLNSERVKPSKEVRCADTVEVRIGEVRRTVVVKGVADKRGPARVVATLYEETPESIAGRERGAAERRLARPPGADLGLRPTKQGRRRIDALRRPRRNDRRDGA